MPKRKVKTEEDQWAALKRIMVKGSVTKPELAKFRASATNKSGWSTARLDAWLAGLVEARKVRTPAFQSQGRRDAAKGKGEGTAAEREHGRVRDKVQRWVARRTEGTVSAAHLLQMKENLRRGVTAKGIEAIIVELEDSKDITLEDRVKGLGGRSRPDWRREAREWASARGWPVPTTATPTTGQPVGPEEVAVEMGSGWEGATEGLRRVWGRVITMDMKRQTLVHRGAKSTPDFLTTFEEAATHPGGAALWAARRAGAKKGELAAIWLSPDCTHWSTAQGFQKDTSGKGVYGDRPARTTLTLTLGWVAHSLAMQGQEGGSPSERVWGEGAEKRNIVYLAHREAERRDRGQRGGQLEKPPRTRP